MRSSTSKPGAQGGGVAPRPPGAGSPQDISAKKKLILDRARVEGFSAARVTTPDAIPQAAGALAKTGKYDAVIALGTVIRGGTAHFEYVAGGASNGLAHVAQDSGIPVAFGVLTTESIEQAIERAGTKAGNKGAEAALTALEMINVLKAIKA